MLDAVYFKFQIPGIKLKVVTYGQPRVGNPAFASYVDANVSFLERCVFLLFSNILSTSYLMSHELTTRRVSFLCDLYMFQLTLYISRPCAYPPGPFLGLCSRIWGKTYFDPWLLGCMRRTRQYG